MTDPKGAKAQPQESTALVVISPEQVALEVQRIQPMFPRDCSREQMIALAGMALQYGLDPVAGELTLYQGRTYVTIDGRIRIAHKDPNYQGFKEDRPATPEEYKALRMDPEKNFLWYVELQRRDWPYPIKSWGRVRLTEPPPTPPGQKPPYAPSKYETSPIARTEPHLLAQKRAKWRAFRDGFPLPIPGAEEDEEISTQPQLFQNPQITGAEITKAQNKLLHAMRREFQIPDDEYRELIRNHYGVDHTNELMAHEAEELIDWIEQRSAAWTGETTAEQEDLPSIDGQDWEAPEPETGEQEPERAIPEENTLEMKDKTRGDAIKRCREFYDVARTLGIPVPGKPETSWSTEDIDRWNNQVADKIAQIKNRAMPRRG